MFNKKVPFLGNYVADGVFSSYFSTALADKSVGMLMLHCSHLEV